MTPRHVQAHRAHMPRHSHRAHHQHLGELRGHFGIGAVRRCVLREPGVATNDANANAIANAKARDFIGFPSPGCSAKKKTPRMEYVSTRGVHSKVAYIFSMIALPNSEHLSNFAPVIRRSKSYVTVLFAIVRPIPRIIASPASCHPICSNI